VPAGLVSWCERCGARHVDDGVFRFAGGQAQLAVTAGEGRGTLLHPAPRHRKRRTADPRGDLLAAYLRVNGPTAETTYRDWLGGDTRAARGAWRAREDLVGLQVDGSRLQVPEELLDAVREAPAARGVVLVPPHDPYLRQVDRTRLVPDRARRQQVWRAVSAPGALLVDGEVAGTWRHRRSERRLTVTPFEDLGPARRKAVAASAALVAEASGDDVPALAWE
jgi:hypothetical protein